MWTGIERKPVIKYLALTFLIAWASELFLIMGERTGILHDSVGFIVTYAVIGFGAGFAPAYAVYILLKKSQQIRGIRDFCKLIFNANHSSAKRTILTTAVFFASQLIASILVDDYLGGAWYLFIVTIPLMMIGGGIEEIGWRGFFQPALEDRFSFPVAGIVTGAVWAVWHLPLWFVVTASQSSLDFFAFLSFCIVFSFVLAVLYKLTRNVFACVMLHAWSNVLGSMFERGQSELPDAKTLVLYSIEIVLSIAIYVAVSRNDSGLRGNDGGSSRE
ncbi:CAAX amino protease [Clostridia bacterium]|nr:CAAX amino protease [Clostridia bacterium]